MEKYIVHSAARNGKILELIDLLRDKAEDQVRALVSDANDEEITPLLLACQNGHLDVATYLIEKCRVDVDQSGYVEEMLRTPLSCAAYYGHLNIVKTLIEHKASVNKEDRTPLLCACMTGNFEITKYLIEHGADIERTYMFNEDTCLTVACQEGHYHISKYVLECGADVNRKTRVGETALHCAVKSYSLGILKLLLKHGARISTDEDGFTPLLLAAFLDHALIMEFFFEKCTKLEKVNALELRGAAHVYRHHTAARARYYWRQAMKLRYEDGAFAVEKPIDESPISSYIDAKEVRSLQQLDELTDDEIQVQSLLVMDRILGPGRRDSKHCIRRIGARYAEHGNFEKCIQILKYKLDADIDREINRVDIKFIFNVGFEISLTLSPLTEVFYKMMSESGNFEKYVPSNSFRHILHVFENTLQLVETALNTTIFGEDDFSSSYYLQYFLITAMHLLSLMCRLQQFLKPNDKNSLRKAAYKLVQLNPKGRNGFTLLHIASYRCPTPLRANPGDPDYNYHLPETTFPSLEVVDLLLEVGASPNALDSGNNTPLHVAAMNRPCNTDVFYTLLKHGAHIDLCNNENQTPLQLVDDLSLPGICPLQYLQLQCLAARAINKHKIPYVGLVAKQLCDLVDMHVSR